MTDALARAHEAARDKRYNEAHGICEDVLTTSPDNATALALLGVVTAQLGDDAAGISMLERAISLNSGVANWHGNLGTLYHRVFRLGDAVKAAQEAIRVDPQDADHLVNMSLILSDMDDHDNAIACLVRALGLKPDHGDAHLALAENLLALGQFAPGWKEYEWRNDTPSAHVLPKMTSAEWNGMALPRGKLLVCCDQGYGDTIQFARYIPRLKELCQEVILGCSPEMTPLLSQMARCCNRWVDTPPHAAHCRLTSVPYLLGTTLETIPAADAPYLTYDNAKRRAWAERLPHGRLRVGLAWTGRPEHPNDRRRSMPLSRLLPLATAGVRFVSLQKPMPECDRPLLEKFGMEDWSGELKDFGDTAALVANLDLVITVDTAVGHLAGALGKPVWIMVSKSADWRWMLNRTDSPWYPTARLFRQQTPGYWPQVVHDVAEALATL